MTSRLAVLASAFLASALLAVAPPARAQATPPRLGDGLHVGTPAAVGLDPSPLLAIDSAIADGSFPRTTSVLVAREGVLAFEAYFGEGGREVLNDTRSAMKSVTSLALGIALADGLLRSVDEPAFARLGDLAPFEHHGPTKAAITLADFLTMSSALECDDWDPASPGNEERMYPRQEWARWAVDLPVREGWARDSTGRGPFSYCTAGVFLLGRIIERAASQPVDEFVNDRLLDPLGITAREWPRSPAGEAMTGGGLRLRSRDLLKLGLLLLEGGRWRGEQIVPVEWVHAALTERRRVDSEQGYGYLFWHRTYGSACGPVEGWFMSGNGGNVVVVAPAIRLVAVVTRRHYNRPGMHRETVELLEDHVFAALRCGGAD